MKVRNYRLYFIGQSVSLCGTWMQSVALSWLMLKLTGSGTALGAVTALQFLPILLLAPYGGVLADRFSKRRLLVVTQTSAGVLALVLGTLVATGLVQLWMVYVVAFCLGVVNAVDNPVRQTFVHELVGSSALGNAITLNSVIVNLSRVIGPALAGIVIAKVGIAPCFIINGVSFGAVLGCLGLMDGSRLRRSKPVKTAKGQLADGFRYAWRTPIIRDALLMMTIVGTFTFEFSVALPMLAKFTFHGDAGTVASLMSAMGIGAVVGGLSTAGRRRTTMKALTIAAFGFGAADFLLAVSPTLPIALLAMVVVGFVSVAFTSSTNTLLQTESAASMRGRVMALWAMAFLGTTLFGAPLIGWVGQHADPRWSLAVGGVGGLAAGIVGLVGLRRRREPVVRNLPASEPPRKAEGCA